MKKLFKIYIYLLLPMMLFAAPAAEYKMDEPAWNGTAGEVIDSIGSNDGTSQNGASITTDGISNSAGSFDGKDDYIQLQDELAVLRGTSSMSFWVKTNQRGNNTAWQAPAITGIEQYRGRDDIFWGTIDSSGHIGINVGDGPSTMSSTAINDNKWHNVVITRDSSSGELVVYVDGIEEARKVDTSGIIGNTFSSLGCRENTRGSRVYYRGKLDEVEMFDTVLDAEDARKLYFKYHKTSKPVVEYRMDECYWFDNGNGVEDDVKDETTHRYHATSYNTASINMAGKINHAGYFANDADYVATTDSNDGNINGKLSVSFWVKLDKQMGSYTAVLTKSKSHQWDDGWGFVNPNNSSGNTLRFFIESFGNYAETTIATSDDWVHIIATYDGSVIRLYKNGVSEASASVSNLDTSSNDPIRLADDDGSGGDSTLEGFIDEVKIWDSALTSAEVQYIFENEQNGTNYDGSTRNAVECSASIAKDSWELVGIPADFRNPSNTKTTIEDIFGDDMNGTYGTDWRVYRREYNTTDNNSSYVLMDITDKLKFGVGYWLGSKLNSIWSANGAIGVDYDSLSNGTYDCPTGRCVEIPMTSISLDEATTDLKNSGPYRYFMTGFVGKVPVDWADCRFIINGVAYTPSDADDAGYVNKQIWQYNPNSSDADSKGYTTCDDVTPGNCKLIPYKGFWVELHGKTKNKLIKLLIPKG